MKISRDAALIEKIHKRGTMRLGYVEIVYLTIAERDLIVAALQDAILAASTAAPQQNGRGEGRADMNEAIELLPCPFCGRDLTRGSRRINPNARCTTADCYGAKMPVVNLDVPDSVAAWNKRAALPPLRARGEIAELPTKLMQIADGALDDPADEAVMRDAADALVRILSRTAGQEWRDISSEMLGALQGMHAFIAVMFGRGPDATIPETVNAPIGVPIKVGEIMREATAVIAKAEVAFPAPPVAKQQTADALWKDSVGL